VEDELVGAFGVEAKVSLFAGSGGVFEVVVDGKQVFSKQEVGHFPVPGEVVSLIQT